MSDPVGIILFSLGLIYFLFQTFVIWQEPNRYLLEIHNRRRILSSKFPFIPKWIIGFIFFYEKPNLSIWWARILSLFAVMICILGLIASIHRSF